MTQSQYENQKNPVKLPNGSVIISNYKKSLEKGHPNVLALYFVSIKLKNSIETYTYALKRDGYSTTLYTLDNDGNVDKPTVFSISEKERKEVKPSKELDKKSINKSKPMATEKQLAARKRFAAAAKNGTLAKQRAAASKKGLNAPAKRKKTITSKKLCSKVIPREGIKLDGTLKKGYHYTPGGKVVKAVAKKKVATKKKVVAKKPTSKKKVVRKKFLGIF